jgi:hypothetical protein
LDAGDIDLCPGLATKPPTCSKEGSERCFTRESGYSRLQALGLATDPPLRFELIDVHVGINTIGILYRSIYGGPA